MTSDIGIDTGGPAHARRQSHRPQHLRGAGHRPRQAGLGQQCVHRDRGSVQRGQMHARRQPDFGARVQFDVGVPHRIPPDQRLHRGDGRLRDHCHDTTVRAGPHLRRGRQPPPQGVLGRPQVLAAQQCPTVQQKGGSVPVRCAGFGPRRGHHQNRARVDGADHRFPRRCDDGDAGERPAELPRRYGVRRSPRPAPHPIRTVYIATRCRRGRTSGIPPNRCHPSATTARCSAGTARWCDTGYTPATVRSRAAAPAPAPDGAAPAPPAPPAARPTAAARCGRPGRVPRRSRRPPARPPAGRGRAPPAGWPPRRAPNRCAPAPAPPRCGHSHRSPPRSAVGAPEASPPRGRADTERAALPGCRLRRPRQSPDPGCAPERTPRYGCRSPVARRRVGPSASAGSGPTVPALPTARRRRLLRSAERRCATGRQHHADPAPPPARCAHRSWWPPRPRPAGGSTAHRATPATPRGPPGPAPVRSGTAHRGCSRPSPPRPARVHRKALEQLRFHAPPWRAGVAPPAAVRRRGCPRNAPRQHRPIAAPPV